MYSISLFNNGVETIIHYPSADKETPHLLNLDLKESLSKAEELSFTVPYVNPGYNLVNGLKTKVKITDTRDNSIIFSGRIIPLKSDMSGGKFEKNVTCEGALSYLNDTNTRRWNFINKTPTQILTYLLNAHNATVDNDRKIQLGTIEITQPITIDTNYESTLNAIVTKLHNILGGDIRVRETTDILYLDYLTDLGENNDVEVKLGYNLKDMVVEYDPLEITTRVIPLGYGEGINQLTIAKVNDDLEYIQDALAIAEYGVIEGVATNKDIQNADTLKIYGQNVLAEKKQIKLVYTQSQLDLSVLSGHENEKYSLGDTIHTLCSVMDVDVYARVIERTRDLINSPWNPTLVISTRPISLSDQIVDLRQRNLSLENAPQGNTVIFPIQKYENADATHPITLDLDIPKETININRVYINLHGRKYRANSKDSASGGGVATTSASGGGSTTSSASGGGSTKNITTPPASDYDSGNTVEVVTSSSAPNDPHFHYLPNSLMAMAYQHTHSFIINILAHVHTITIEAHTHAITILAHIHNAIYGIFESTYAKDVKIKINGVDIGVIYSGDVAIDEYNIDITSHIVIGNNKIEISTTQNGRIEAIVYSQIFIQSK
jgi:phage minor structural protein